MLQSVTIFFGECIRETLAVGMGNGSRASRGRSAAELRNEGKYFFLAILSQLQIKS